MPETTAVEAQTWRIRRLEARRPVWSKERKSQPGATGWQY